MLTMFYQQHCAGEEKLQHCGMLFSKSFLWSHSKICFKKNQEKSEMTLLEYGELNQEVVYVQKLWKSLLTHGINRKKKNFVPN